jgi:hypothetical protein
MGIHQVYRFPPFFAIFHQMQKKCGQHLDLDLFSQNSLSARDFPTFWNKNSNFLHVTKFRRKTVALKKSKKKMYKKKSTEISEPRHFQFPSKKILQNTKQVHDFWHEIFIEIMSFWLNLWFLYSNDFGEIFFLLIFFFLIFYELFIFSVFSIRLCPRFVRCLSVWGAITSHGVGRSRSFMARSIAYDPRTLTTEGIFFGTGPCP